MARHAISAHCLVQWAPQRPEYLGYYCQIIGYTDDDLHIGRLNSGQHIFGAYRCFMPLITRQETRL